MMFHEQDILDTKPYITNKSYIVYRMSLSFLLDSDTWMELHMSHTSYTL
jgi:hypothetical protein